VEVAGGRVAGAVGFVAVAVAAAVAVGLRRGGVRVR